MALGPRVSSRAEMYTASSPLDVTERVDHSRVSADEDIGAPNYLSSKSVGILWGLGTSRLLSVRFVIIA
jgi:hypothetical protein